MSRSPRPIVLTTEEVSISKAFVTLKTIRVNDRQMTQSVFKQLPRAEMVNPATLRLTGVVWGWVNYDLSHYQHRNFVFQVGSELRRCEFWVEDFDAVYELCRLSPHAAQHSPYPPFSVRQQMRSFREDDRMAWFVYRERWDELMDELRLSEQLFIAA